MRSGKIALGLGLLSLVTALGCGSGAPILPRLSGNYSNASLNGSYVYEVHGFALGTQSIFPYREIGVFTADGNGNITAGSDDSNFNASGTAVTGSYQIGQDGSGVMTLNTSLGPINLLVTMVAGTCIQANPLPCTSNAYLMEADSGLTAAGTAVQQDSTATSSTPSGTFVYRLHQESSAENSSPSSEVGAVALSNGSGSGSMDQNLTGSFSSPGVTWTLNAPLALGRGTGSFLNTSTNFTTDFVYYIVNSSRMVLLVSTPNAVGSGAAELQSGNISAGLSGSYAFGSRGDDSNSFSGLNTVGQFTATSGSIAGTEDVNQDGTVSSNLSYSSCYTAAASGRVAVNSASGGNCTTTLTQVFWMVSPSRAFFVNASATGAEDGTADLQTTSSFTNAGFKGQYGIVMDGWDATPESLSRAGTLQFDGTGRLTLVEFVNNSFSGGASSPQGGALAGPYAASANGRITGSLGNSALGSGALNFVMYAVSPSQAYVLQTDSGIFTSGTIQLQQ